MSKIVKTKFLCIGEEISRGQFRSVFETDEQKLRDNKLDNILKKDNE
jgi:hypothetical protein